MLRTRTATPLLLLTILALALLGAACADSSGDGATTRPGTASSAAAAAGTETGSTPATGTATATTAGSPEAQQLAAARQLTQCARDHGQAEFPDPVLEGGAPVWPGVDKQAIVDAQDACPDVMAQFPPQPLSTSPMNPEKMASMLEFAQCVRDHGIADWPDPRADGTFPLIGTSLDFYRPPFQDVPQAVTDAVEACWDLQGGGGGWRIFAS